MNNFWFKQISKTCFCIIIVLIMLIIIKFKPSLKKQIYNVVFEKNITFASINSIYQKYAGSALPFSNLLNKSTTVFNESLKYREANKYKDGVKLLVDNNYLVPVLNRGLVIFVGEKEEYGSTVIVQQENGVDVWYSNIKNTTVGIYDYIEQGKLIGETIDNNLYLVFKKNGEVLNYQDYI